MATNELLTLVAQVYGLLGVVALQNFTDANAVPFVLVASIVLPIILLSTARWLGIRGGPAGVAVLQPDAI